MSVLLNKLHTSTPSPSLPTNINMRKTHYAEASGPTGSLIYCQPASISLARKPTRMPRYQGVQFKVSRGPPLILEETYHVLEQTVYLSISFRFRPLKQEKWKKGLPQSKGRSNTGQKHQETAGEWTRTRLVRSRAWAWAWYHDHVKMKLGA